MRCRRYQYLRYHIRLKLNCPQQARVFTFLQTVFISSEGRSVLSFFPVYFSKIIYCPAFCVTVTPAIKVLNILKAPSPKYLYTAAFNFFSWSRDTIPLIPPQKRPPVCEKKLGYRATPPIGYTAWHPIRQGAQPMRGRPVYGQNERDGIRELYAMSRRWKPPPPGLRN